MGSIFSIFKRKGNHIWILFMMHFPSVSLSLSFNFLTWSSLSSTAWEAYLNGEFALWNNLLPLLHPISFIFTSKSNIYFILNPNEDSWLWLYVSLMFLHLQLSEAAQYAREKRVILKGDLPIGVDRNSVDTWVNPTLFRMNTSTGAPPDYFDKNGQNWGFPTYNWEEMSKDNYAWWRARLTQVCIWWYEFMTILVYVIENHDILPVAAYSDE